MYLGYNDKILRLEKALGECSYSPSMKQIIKDEIICVLNYKGKKDYSRFFLRTLNQDKIIMVWYPMTVKFTKRNYMVPINIFFSKNYPYEPPQIFLEVVQGSAPNPHNYDVDPNTNKIMTYTLKNWNQFSRIETIMNEIDKSFSGAFPIYKTSQNSSIYSLANKNQNSNKKLNMQQQISEIKYNKFNDYKIYNVSDIFKNIEISKNDDEKDYNNKKNILCNCPDCGSFIKILNENYKKIEFKCPICNKNDEKGVKEMLIEDYLSSLSNNKCNICKTEKNENLKLCTKCKLIICNDCINNHIEQSQNKCSEEFFINYNEIGNKCFQHPNNINMCFCNNCQKHLCSECLKSKEHKSHIKTDFIEIKPSEYEIDRFLRALNLIRSAKNSYKRIQTEKIGETRNNGSKQEFNIIKLFQGKISKINSDMEKEIEDENKKYSEECDELYQEFLKQVDLKKNNLEKKVKEINGKYEKLFNDEKKIYEKNIDELNNKLKKVYEILCEKDFPMLINNINNFIKINESFYHSFLENENNYYANANFDKITNIFYDFMELIDEMKKDKNNIILQLNDNDLVIIKNLDDDHGAKNSEKIQDKKE